MMKRLLTYTTLLLVQLLLTGCEHKDLTYDDSADLQVRFDWTDTKGEMAPMLFVVFSAESAPITKTFASSHGGNVVLLSQKPYTFIGYNDPEYLTTRGGTWDKFEICCKTTSLELFSPLFSRTRRAPRAAGTESQAVIEQAERMCTSASAISSLNFGSNTITMQQQEATETYTFTITHVENMLYIKGLSASISGMSASWYPSRSRCADTQCIVPFTMEEVEENTLSGSVRVFGHCPLETKSDHMLVLYLELNDGTKWYYTFDVTEQMHDGSSQTDDRVTAITLDGLPIPKPITNSSGLQPEMDEWNEIILDYPIL